MNTVETSSYIVRDTRADGRTAYISAPKGYFRKADGTIEKDGTPSPEITFKRAEAYEFSSRLSATRNANLTATGEVVEV